VAQHVHLLALQAQGTAAEVAECSIAEKEPMTRPPAEDRRRLILEKSIAEWHRAGGGWEVSQMAEFIEELIAERTMKPTPPAAEDRRAALHQVVELDVEAIKKSLSSTHRGFPYRRIVPGRATYFTAKDDLAAAITEIERLARAEDLKPIDLAMIGHHMREWARLIRLAEDQQTLLDIADDIELNAVRVADGEG
jgi:hypothetical protein